MQIPGEKGVSIDGAQNTTGPPAGKRGLREQSDTRFCVFDP